MGAATTVEQPGKHNKMEAQEPHIAMSVAMHGPKTAKTWGGTCEPLEDARGALGLRLAQEPRTKLNG